MAETVTPPQRLQKVLASAGVGSRRVCEELIAEGRVTVDGQPAELGLKVDARTAAIHVDGARVVTDDRIVHLAVNKPVGVLSAMSDDRGRKTLADLLPDLGPRLFHIGRLDADSEGLLLVSNDGELAHRLTHPSYGVPKTYRCEVSGSPTKAARRRLLAGVDLEDGAAAADQMRVVSSLGDRALIELVIHEGRNRIVRRLLDEVGHPVLRLIRTQIGPIRLNELRPGRTRHLSLSEVGQLYQAVGL
ncbi:MAG: pseudouridine synthase [Micromonosporaceae bacterium]